MDTAVVVLFENNTDSQNHTITTFTAYARGDTLEKLEAPWSEEVLPELVAIGSIQDAKVDGDHLIVTMNPFPIAEDSKPA